MDQTYSFACTLGGSTSEQCEGCGCRVNCTAGLWKSRASVGIGTENVHTYRVLLGESAVLGCGANFHCVNLHRYNHTYVHTYINIHTFIHAHTYIHTCTHIQTFIDEHTHTYIHTRTYIHTYIHTYTRTIHTHIHTYIYTYIHMYVHI